MVIKIIFYTDNVNYIIKTFYDWSSAFMFGSIVSCTDPIAVVSLLNEIGAS